MQQATATRRLVKSPPELWAELSREDVLGRHLADFGEIRITRRSPQTTVAWEGDRASGTVELAPTGWGTKVILTATPVGEPVVEHAAQAAAPDPPPEPRRALLAAPLAPADAAPAAIAPPPQPADDEPAPRRRGFFARLFRRRAGADTQPPQPEPASSIPAPPAPGPDPVPPTPTPDPGPLPPAPDPVPPAPAPAPPPPPQIRARPALDADRTAEILAEVLDDLGAAHHRPFSRG